MQTTELDWHICSRARLSRDARFDGRFFIGVNGSGVYCRVICPAPTAKEKNCRYFATAAAAAEAGYRPCLRCRPECAPGTPAWLGTSATVARALRLIEENGLEEDGVDGLAERLGVGSRHLRRLFVQHLGASPTAVARTRRAHFAKKLIDETNLSMTHIAMAAGYGSVRRFNADFAELYQRTPSDIRAKVRAREALPENEYRFLLRFRPPFDWEGMLELIEPTAIPGVEAIDQGSYRRIISLEGVDGHLHVSPEEKRLGLRVCIRFGDPRALFRIVERVRRLFDLNADWATLSKTLGNDPLLAPRLRARPGLRVPGCWDGFELAVCAILSAHAKGPGARELTYVVERFGRQVSGPPGLTRAFPEPHIFANANLVELGVAEKRARMVRDLARAVCDGRVAFDSIVDIEGLLSRLRATTGMDERTAQYVAMRALGEPDAFPANKRLLPANVDSVATLICHAEAWRPWRAYAAIYLGLSEKSTSAGRASIPSSRKRTHLVSPKNKARSQGHEDPRAISRSVLA